MLINKASLDAVFIGVKAVFADAFEKTESHLEKIATIAPSMSAEEDYCWLGAFPGMREWVGDRVIQNPEAFSYSIKNRTFESTFSIPRESIEDDKLGVFKPVTQQLGALARTHPDELLFSLLSAGFTDKCYDGQPFFSTQHPVHNGVASNMQEGDKPAWFLLDTSKAIKPLIFQKRRDYKISSLTNENDENVFMRKEYIYGVDARVNAGYGLWQFAYGSKADLLPENYGMARAAMKSLKSHTGRPLLVNPTLLVVGPQLEDQARELLMPGPTKVGNANIYAGTAELLVSSWLT